MPREISLQNELWYVTLAWLNRIPEEKVEYVVVTEVNGISRLKYYYVCLRFGALFLGRLKNATIQASWLNFCIFDFKGFTWLQAQHLDSVVDPIFGKAIFLKTHLCNGSDKRY